MQQMRTELGAAGLGRLEVVPHTGEELVHDNGRALGPRLRDFWRWSASDLVSNVARGVFAEFLVAHALGIDVSGVRDSWAAFDLVSGASSSSRPPSSMPAREASTPSR
jgi:hypothetical protein